MSRSRDNVQIEREQTEAELKAWVYENTAYPNKVWAELKQPDGGVDKYVNDLDNLDEDYALEIWKEAVIDAIYSVSKATNRGQEEKRGRFVPKELSPIKYFIDYSLPGDEQAHITLIASLIAKNAAEWPEVVAFKAKHLKGKLREREFWDFMTAPALGLLPLEQLGGLHPADPNCLEASVEREEVLDETRRRKILSFPNGEKRTVEYDVRDEAEFLPEVIVLGQRRTQFSKVLPGSVLGTLQHIANELAYNLNWKETDAYRFILLNDPPLVGSSWAKHEASYVILRHGTETRKMLTTLTLTLPIWTARETVSEVWHDLQNKAEERAKEEEKRLAGKSGGNSQKREKPPKRYPIKERDLRLLLFVAEQAQGRGVGELDEPARRAIYLRWNGIESTLDEQGIEEQRLYRKDRGIEDRWRYKSMYLFWRQYKRAVEAFLDWHPALRSKKDHG